MDSISDGHRIIWMISASIAAVAVIALTLTVIKWAAA
jgi:hypothetical protein